MSSQHQTNAVETELKLIPGEVIATKVTAQITYRRAPDKEIGVAKTKEGQELFLGSRERVVLRINDQGELIFWRAPATLPDKGTEVVIREVLRQRPGTKHPQGIDWCPLVELLQALKEAEQVRLNLKEREQLEKEEQEQRRARLAAHAAKVAAELQALDLAVPRLQQQLDKTGQIEATVAQVNREGGVVVSAVVVTAQGDRLLANAFAEATPYINYGRGRVGLSSKPAVSSLKEGSQVLVLGFSRHGTQLRVTQFVNAGMYRAMERGAVRAQKTLEARAEEEAKRQQARRDGIAKCASPAKGERKNKKKGKGK